MGELKPPLQRLALLLGVPGEPIQDYGWTDVVQAVQDLLTDRAAIQRVVDEAADRTCAAYDHALGGPCPAKPKVQGVCAHHAVMCSMCGRGLSVRGICPGCLKVLAAEAREGAQREASGLPRGQVLLGGQRCGECKGQPVYQTPSGSLCPKCGGGVDVEDVPAPKLVDLTVNPSAPKRRSGAVEADGF